MKSKWDIRVLVEGSMMIALSTVLSFIKIYKAPMGGSVTAASMVPIILFSIRHGMPKGILVGSIYGLLQFIVEPYFYHPIQFLLDYIFAFGLLGLSGLVNLIKVENKNIHNIGMILSIFIGILGRCISHVLSGVVFFSEYAGDLNPWIYSIQYNLYYLLPELLISIFLISIIWKPVDRILTK